MKILIPIDRSGRSTALFPLVERLAGPTRAEVILLHVRRPGQGFTAPAEAAVSEEMADAYPTSPEAVEASKHPLFQSQVEASLLASVQDWLEELAEPLRAAGLQVRCEARTGERPAEAIVRFARREDVDFVVMATRRQGVLDRIVRGSVARAVLNDLQRPVLLLRVDQSPTNPPTT